MLATATSGQNVNDKINITNASLTLNKKNNQHDDNTVWPTSNEQLRLSVDMNWIIVLKKEIHSL